MQEWKLSCGAVEVLVLVKRDKVHDAGSGFRELRGKTICEALLMLQAIYGRKFIASRLERRYTVLPMVA
jgi:hypothetical protein